ncbi:hypothetical protein KF840_10340 [bacterium]|nr:hypothetical protein [bacterium]
MPACGDGRLDAGEECDDGNTTARDGCDAACHIEACHICAGEPSVCTTRPPLPACRHTTVDRGAALAVRDAAADRRDKLTWKLRAGEATAKVDFGDPRLDTAYSFCVYDQSAGSDVLALWHRVPAGANWTESRRGFRYVDRTRARDGIQSIRLKAGAAGKTKLRLYGSGLGLDLAGAGLPFDQQSRVTAQLSNGSTCWEAVFTTNRKSSSTRFKALTGQ